MTRHIKEIVISAVALMLIAGIVTAALAGTNALTVGVIAERAEAAETAARKEVISADRFEESTVTVGDAEQVYYVAYAAEKAVGYVFTTAAVGKSAGLTVMTGISSEGVITGVKVTEDNETAGYVDKVKKAGYPDSFVGKEAAPLTVGQDVDAVSQATKTSKGIADAVNKAIAAYQAIKEVSGDGK